ncbi:MAG: DUF916 domain-containing protein [Candidatus Saccharimonadales bacterium]
MSQKNIWRPVGCLLIALAIALTNAPLHTSAATSGGNGQRVSPVRTDVTIYPGKSETVTVNITNVTTKPAELQAVINDFIANPNESGEPAIILNPNQYAPKHSLKRYAKVGVGNFTLGPGQQKNIPVVINIPPNAPGGGYYGAVRFAPASNKNGPNENVSLAGSVGSLILVKVPGDVKEQLSIASFDARVNDRPSTFFFSNKDIDAVVRFQNQGNIQLQPFGKIVLKNRSGKVLGTYEVNGEQPPANVLPDSIRKFPIPLKDKVGSFGQFKLEGNFGYGTNGQLLSASTTFYVIPLWLIIAFVVLVALIAFLVFGMPRLVKAYNRRVLQRAGRR